MEGGTIIRVIARMGKSGGKIVRKFFAKTVVNLSDKFFACKQRRERVYVCGWRWG